MYTITLFFATMILYCMPLTALAATLMTVLDRDELICGIDGDMIGMSSVGKDGAYEGMDVDLCRAVASAVLEDPKAVEFVPLGFKSRFHALMRSEIDLLSRNSTWNYHRDTYQIEFVGVSFYDGQSFIAKRSSGFTSIDTAPKKVSVCVQKHTTTENNLIDYAKKNKHQIEIKPYTSSRQAIEQFFQGGCEIMTADTTELLSIKHNYSPNKDDYIIFSEKISKEPLAPAVRDNDSQWINIVRWTLYALIEAEEQGINSKNIDSLLTSKDPSTQYLLGVKPGIGKALGLTDKWFYNTIKNVGNYAEIYDRNFGPNSGMYIERGLNKLWKNGGLMISPPFK